MKKTIWLSIGFLLFITGFLSLVLLVAGIKLVYLAWMDEIFGPLAGFLMRILMVVGGIVVVYLAVSNWREDE